MTETSDGPTQGPRALRGVIGAVSLASVVVVALALVYVLSPGVRVPPPPPGPPVGFQIPVISGNQSAGWTYTLRALIVSAWEASGPVVWGDLWIGIEYTGNTSSIPYPYPPGTSVRVTDARGMTMATENLTVGVWQEGPYVLIETGQAVVLHGAIPPGTTYVQGNAGAAFVGPTIVVRYTNGGRPFTLLYPLQGAWVQL